MKDLNYYRRVLKLSNKEITDTYDISGTTLAKWLTGGAPLHVLKGLKGFYESKHG